MLTPLGLTPSFGFGDRLGLATPGHIAALRETGTALAPIFAQQSVRENARTGRTPRQVLDDARRAVEAAGWEDPWGADADHLKTSADLPDFVAAGYTFFTVDPGAFVDNTADSDSLETLRQKTHGLAWDELSEIYLGEQAWAEIGKFDGLSLLRAAAKYGKAIAHAVEMYRRLCDMKEEFDYEVSVDETDSPTTPLEHLFIANELTRHKVRFTSLAPRFIGRFEKGVDYIGDLRALDAEMGKHAAVTARFGSYKLSLHSGSDKFSVYPLLVKHWGRRIHVKTAGTSYLEALRVIARREKDLFQKIFDLAAERYDTDRVSYHVSADLARLPAGADFPVLLDDFHAREILHVTFGSALSAYGEDIRAALLRHREEYALAVKTHFAKHLDLLRGQ